MLLISVQQLVKIPRSPPGPSYVAKDISTTQEEQGLNSKSLTNSKKLMLMVLQEEDIEKQAECLFLLQKLTKPQSLGNQLMSEDEIVQNHVNQMQKKYLDFLKETESAYKQKIKEINLSKQRGNQLSTHLYKVKQIVKRVTIEGEHTCLMLLK